MNALKNIATDPRMFRAKHTKTVREIVAKRFVTKEASNEFIDFALADGNQCSRVKDGDGCYTVRVMETV